MDSNQNLCEQFASILNGKSQNQNGVCKVSLQRTFSATVQGKPSKSVVPVGISFESLDQDGKALNLLEIAVLQEEIPRFMYAVVHQGLIVSALHNHSKDKPFFFLLDELSHFLKKLTAGHLSESVFFM